MSGSCASSAVRSARDIKVSGAPSDYAKTFGVMETHLTRTARKSCGPTTASVITERKLHTAQGLLAQPQLTMNCVAESLGFHHAPHSTRFTRSHTGQSPTGIDQRVKTGPRRSGFAR